ncbi:MAG: DUF2085 domain-containing protein [Candidatus Izemoplasma sp.]|nr:DUF2085 domain-containing protein [Candidatus Izemoplasma sp.]
MFCRQCGRDIKENACIHAVPLKVFERIILISIMMFLSMSAFIILPKVYLPLSHHAVLYGYFALSSVLVFVTLLGYILKRPYLAALFNCHQKSSRSLSMLTRLFPICVRCLGIMVGIAMTGILIYWQIYYWVYLILGLPLVIDGYLQHNSHYQSTQIKRFITGLLFGPTVVLIYSMALYLLIILLNYLNPFL